ncbi:MAG: PTS system mannose/fructose/sorbose family transporter subunit IID [Anaerolineales bacterium]
MHISMGLAFVLAFIAGFSYFSRRFMGDLYLERAIVLGPVTGLIMGDMQTGLMLGGTMELIFMGAADIGGSVPPNLPIGSVLGTAFAISGGLSVQEALVIAIPAALLGSFFELIAKSVSTIFVSGAEYFADRGNTNGVSAMVHTGNLAHFLADFLPVFVALSAGSQVVEGLGNAIPASVKTGIGVAGNLLPALGFALLLSTLATTELLPFFFFGFVLAAYANFGVLGAAFVGLLIAAYYIMQSGGLQLVGGKDEGEASMVSGQDQRTIYWRSFAIQSAFSFDRMQALGWTWALIPFLKKLYGNTDELRRALRRHLVFFNTHPWIPGPIFASVAELEARRAKNPDEVDEQSIQGVKGSLMGPLAGIGDSSFHGTWRPLMGGIAASMGLQGNPIAPLFFFLSTNIVHVWVRWFSQDRGFRYGSQLFERVDAERLQTIMRGAAMAGLMGIGGLVGTWLSVTTPLAYTIQNSTVSIQSMLDSIMPKFLPLVVTLLTYWAIRRGARTVILMLVLAIGGFALGALGILGK